METGDRGIRIALYHNLLSGGAKRTLNEVMQRLKGRHQLDVYTLSCANHDFADLRPYVDHYHVFAFNPLPLLPSPFGRINPLSRAIDLLRLQRLTGRIAGEIERQQYDVLFVHPCQYEISASLLSQVRSIPTVYYCQEPLRRAYEPMPVRPYDDPLSQRRALLNCVDPLPKLYNALLKRNDRRNTQRASRVLVNSRYMQEAVEQIYDVKAHVSYHGVDIQRFRPLGHPREPMILSVGSLTPLKGFDFVIDAVGLLAEEERRPLVIVSNFQNPPERAYLERRAYERGVDLELLSNIDDDRLVELYNKAEVVAYAPIREPFGLVPLEAMACGTPIVAVREGGVQESVIHRRTGLFSDRDPAHFAAALRTILNAADLRAAYGRQAREHVVRHWSWEQAVARLEDHLLTAADPHATSKGNNVFASAFSNVGKQAYLD